MDSPGALKFKEVVETTLLFVNRVSQLAQAPIFGVDKFRASVFLAGFDAYPPFPLPDHHR